MQGLNDPSGLVGAVVTLELPHARHAPCGILREHLHDRVDERGGRVGAERLEARRLGRDDRGVQQPGVRAEERAPAGEHLVEHDAERPDVGAGVGRRAVPPFGADVGQGA